VADPLVSIVLPTFNGARFLSLSVESCINQSYRNWELIIVDDASTDGTPDIIEAYCSRERRIRSVRHSVNGKLPASLNTGFALAEGDLLTWTSDDNCFRPAAIEVMADFLKANHQVDVVYAERTLIDENGNPCGYEVARPPEELPYWNSVGGCFLFRRSVADAVGPYNEASFLAEDYEYWLRALGSFRFAALYEDLYLYRVHKDSLSSTQPDGIKLATRRLLEDCLARMNWNATYRGLAYLRLARDAASVRDYRAARRYFRRAAVESPTKAFGRLGLPAVIPMLFGFTAYQSLKEIYVRLADLLPRPRRIRGNRRSSPEEG
jgi:glycosyltransferase involved in cell wall biosynthesis